MRTKAVKDFINNHEQLFWYSPQPKEETVSDELLVESVLNYGEWNEVMTLFRIMGINAVAQVFRGMTGRKKQNFFPEIWNYFNLYFNKHVY